MLKIICAKILLLMSAALLGQHSISLSPTSDLKKIQDGYVVSQFTMVETWSQTELDAVTAWVASNSASMTIEIDGNALVLKIIASYNVRNTYGKFFMKMNVETIQITTENGVVLDLDKEAFFTHFNL